MRVASAEAGRGRREMRQEHRSRRTAARETVAGAEGLRLNPQRLPSRKFPSPASGLIAVRPSQPICDRRIRRWRGRRGSNRSGGAGREFRRG